MVPTCMGGGDFARTLHCVRLAPPPRMVAYSSFPKGSDVPVDVFIQKPDVIELERLFGPALRREARELAEPGRRSR